MSATVLDRLLGWEAGTAAGAIVAVGLAAIIGLGLRRVLADRSLRRERTPAAEGDSPADTGPWSRLDIDHPHTDPDHPDSGDSPGD